MTKSTQKGFTLIELMIVVAIIGILAAVALPAYQNYVNKARYAEVISSVGAFKTEVELCASNLGTLTGCTSGSNDVSAAVTNANTSKYLASISVTDGVISAAARTVEGLNAETYILDPTLAGSKVSWTINTSSTCLGKGFCKQ
jgi:type IV pilus assembly protein PilA